MLHALHENRAVEQCIEYVVVQTHAGNAISLRSDEGSAGSKEARILGPRGIGKRSVSSRLCFFIFIKKVSLWGSVPAPGEIGLLTGGELYCPDCKILQHLRIGVLRLEYFKFLWRSFGLSNY